jgi:hypothetical protein
VAESDEAEDLELALGQVVRSVGRLGGQPGSQVRLEVRAALGGETHRLDELGVGSLLEDVAQHAGLHGLAREGGLGLHGQDHDPSLG